MIILPDFFGYPSNAVPSFVSLLFFKHLSCQSRDATLAAELAALVPKPRINLTRFHSVFAPNSKHRALVTPAKRGKGRKKPKTSALLKSRGRSVADTGDLTRAMTFCGLSRCYRLLGMNGDFCGITVLCWPPGER